ncbi:TetR family transcriptional regulator [Clostridium pasteurianum]|uniref:Transcriptional regulator n=1 Tax=Clostridium pasteurianum BC1 TaxID=86416 RepID=R4K8V1_CLOPA|nr:TetR family transcriptional regulator [Clostridium pasteurianum]AGK98983.1 transcriptional regulator [Clostridium pasteurianum BC1]
MANELKLSKDIILDAAEKLIRRYGSEKTSVIDIAKELHVSHGMIYRYFPSKSSLQEDVTERWLNRALVSLKTIAEETKGTAIECLTLWMDTLIKFKRTNSISDPELFMMYTKVTLESTEMISKHMNELIMQISNIVKYGMNYGEFKTGEPEAIGKSIFIATSRFHHPAHSYEWLADNIDEDFQGVWKLILSGILE